MYLKVVNGTKSKEYTLTSQYNVKPYLIVDGTNKLPLTTNPPVDYASSSESGTFYTTAENAENLSEAAALTRQSTYETIYNTRASTYNTVYGTETQSRSSWSGLGINDGLSCSVYNISRSQYANGGYTFWGDKLTWTRNINYEHGVVDSYVTYYQEDTWLRVYSTKTCTTGTTYLTRASTSSTMYLTRSSTSLYSGVSSTSSSTSYNTRPGSNAYIKIINGTRTLRPLEYRSSSESASMYTTVDVDNWYLLSETTALTRESTSKTVYNTRASTYNTLYGTQRQNRSSWSGIGRQGGDAGIKCSVYNISRSQKVAPGYTFWGDKLTWKKNLNYQQGVVDSYAIYYQEDTWIAFYSYRTVTTGTTYQTRASTYQTIYQTCESTYAYSGLSTSSQSAMSWV